jgi:hypothetical protein
MRSKVIKASARLQLYRIVRGGKPFSGTLRLSGFLPAHHLQGPGAKPSANDFAAIEAFQLSDRPVSI